MAAWFITPSDRCFGCVALEPLPLPLAALWWWSEPGGHAPRCEQQQPISAVHVADLRPSTTVNMSSDSGIGAFKRTAKKGGSRIDSSAAPKALSSSLTRSSYLSSSSPSSSSQQQGMRLSSKRRNPRVKVGALRRGGSPVDAFALPLGMSIAAFVSQVLERKESSEERMSVDRLAMLCTSAVRESLTNVFGEKVNCFVGNFEKSFESTLKTIRLINESAGSKGRDHLHNSDIVSSNSSLHDSPCKGGSVNSTCETEEMFLPAIETHEKLSTHEGSSMNLELVLHQQINQGSVCVSSSMVGSQGSAMNHSMLSTLEKSVIEQARYNDLKAFELSLQMKKLQLKEEQVALHTHSNRMERVKLFMGISKASFKADKFKNQLEETRHADLLKRCVDCLVAGLVIMSAALSYGVYVHSYKRIIDATESCKIDKLQPMSWWTPKPMASINSGFHILRCQVQIMNRMVFGILMIIAVAYLLLQRSASVNQTMPITFIFLLLGVACGFTGKLCVDALGGDGYHWLFYWETLCALHLFSHVWTSALFLILHGPVTVSQGGRSSSIFPFRLRRLLYYGIVLLFLPVSCGLLPFAAPSEWKDRFFLLATDFMNPTVSD